MARKDTERLDALYAELPTIECRGKCHDSCGPIGMTRLERRRIAAAGVDIHVRPGNGRELACSALTMLNRCSVYAVRPIICRIWGLTKALQCSYGCVPEGGFLTEAQAYEFLARAADIAGETAAAARFRRVAALPNLERAVWGIRSPMGAVDEAAQCWNRTT
jgi:Fe-S-cluster containining protein